MYCPRSSGGGSTKAILLSLGGIVVVFEMVVWPVTHIIAAILNYSVNYYYFFNDNYSFPLPFKSKTVYFPILATMKDLSEGFFLSFVFCVLFTSVSIYVFAWLLILLGCLDDCFPSLPSDPAFPLKINQPITLSLK